MVESPPKGFGGKWYSRVLQEIVEWSNEPRNVSDESQLAVRRDLLKFKTFESKEEGEEFIKNWDEKKGQLSALTHGKKWFVALPSVPSQIIENSIKRTEQLLKTNVEFGFEWIVGKNWADCH